MTQLIHRQTHRKQLANGITVLVSENPTSDIIATRCFFKGGTSVEVANQAGLVHLAASLLTKGTIDYTSQEIAERVESIGASLGTEAASDYFLLSFKTVSADFPEVLSLAASILRSANFPTTELDLERRLTIQAIKSQQERPFTVAYDRLQQLVYGSHPYGFPSLGTESTIGQIAREDLLSYHQTYFRPDRMVVSVAGRITVEKAVAQIESVLGDWQSLSNPPVSLPSEIQFQPVSVTTRQETQQAIVMLGYPAPEVGSPDYAALKLIATYLGNGLSSRLFVELREKRGLAYEVSAFYPTRLESSLFVAYMGTAPQNVDLALDGLHHECDRLSQELLTAEELQTAKSKLLGQYALGKQTNGQIAQVFGWYETLGLGVAFDRDFVTKIEAATVAEVQRAAQVYLAKPAISLVGPLEGDRSVVEK